MAVKRYDETLLTNLGRRVAPNREDSDLCFNILKHAASGTSFVEYISWEIRGGAAEEELHGEVDPSVWLASGTEIYPTAAAYVGNDYGIMSKTARLLGSLQRRDAASPGVWALINARMMDAKIVEPAWLAAGIGGNGRPGSKDLKNLIEETISDPGADNQRVKEMARLIFRRFAGGYRGRGRRDMYLICPPARAWWIFKIAEESISMMDDELEGLDNPLEELANILLTGAIWEKLCEKFVSQLTVTGDENIRNGIFLFLLGREHQLQGDDSGQGGTAGGRMVKARVLEDILRRIGQVCSWRALGSLPASEVRKVIETDIAPYSERLYGSADTSNGPKAN